MPFGKKSDEMGFEIDFDAVYNDLIKPAINEVGLEPIRADEEQAGGIIHKSMFERLLFCDYAVADLTTTNANVYYELGIRHAYRPRSTVLLYAEGRRLPFDTALLRTLPYVLANDGKPQNPDSFKKILIEQLNEAKKVTVQDLGEVVDSPIFQLIEGYPKPKPIDHSKTDVFREQVQYSNDAKQRLTEIREDQNKKSQEKVEALKAIEKELGNIEDVESGIVIDLFLSYRAVAAWGNMIELVEKMPKPLSTTVMVQEQLGLAFNRAEQGNQAELVLTELLERRGPSSETYGILGRVYKDRWKTAWENGDKVLAPALLKKAIDAYLKGFEADWRDAYAGINILTLMEAQEPPDERREKLMPVVDYAVDRRMATGKPDYWDYATKLEIAILNKDEAGAMDALGEALTAVREAWEPVTTADNFSLIHRIREARGEDVSWLIDIEERLRGSSGKDH